MDLLYNPIPFNSTMVALGWGVLPGYTEATSKAVCEWMEGTWANVLGQNFDHVGNALHTLLQTASTSEWVDVAYQSVDSTGAW